MGTFKERSTIEVCIGGLGLATIAILLTILGIDPVLTAVITCFSGLIPTIFIRPLQVYQNLRLIYLQSLALLLLVSVITLTTVYEKAGLERIINFVLQFLEKSKVKRFQEQTYGDFA